MKFNVDKIKVGERIFNIRNKLNLTLEQFGKLDNLKASKSIVLRWENGTSLPNRSRLEIIAKKGNITVNELLYGDVEEFITNNFYELLKIASNPVYINDRFTSSNKYDLENLFFKNYNHESKIKFELNYIEDIFTASYFEYTEYCKNSIIKNLKIINDNINLARHYYKHNIVGNSIRSINLELLFKPFYENKNDIYGEELEEIRSAKSLSFIIDKVKDDIDTRDIFIYSGILNELIFSMNKDEEFRNDDIDMIFNNHKIELLNLNDFVYYLDESPFMWPTGETYNIPLKINKYGFLNYENLYGVYIKDIETTYILANYIDFKLHYGDDEFISLKKEYYSRVNNHEVKKTFNNIHQLDLEDKFNQLNNKFSLLPLNTEAKYFVLNHDNSYQITKITEIPNCKYIAPIIGTLE